MMSTSLEVKLWQALIQNDEQVVRDLMECQPIEWGKVCTESTMNAVDIDDEGEAQS